MSSLPYAPTCNVYPFFRAVCLILILIPHPCVTCQPKPDNLNLTEVQKNTIIRSPTFKTLGMCATIHSNMTFGLFPMCATIPSTTFGPSPCAEGFPSRTFVSLSCLIQGGGEDTRAGVACGEGKGSITGATITLSPCSTKMPGG